MNIIYVRATDVRYDPRVQKEVNSLIKNGENSVEILSWDRSGNGEVRCEQLELSDGVVKVYYFPIAATWGGGPKKNLRAILTFIKLAKGWIKDSVAFDAIHFCELPIAIGLLNVVKRKKMKVVYDIYDYYPDLRKSNKLIRKILILMENHVIKRADAVIICNEERMKQIGKAKYKKIEIIHNSPASIEIGQCDIQSRSENIKFVYVGNLVEERLIDIIVEFFQTNSNYELHIGGVGTLAEAVQKSSGSYDNIFYYGKMEYKNVLSLERQCDVLIALYDPSIPNHKYVAANKFYEALYLGKPIIMCKHTGLDKVVEEEKIGATIEPSLAGLEKGVEEVVRKKEEWPVISQREETIFRQQYAWDIMEKRLIELYKKL